jgi:hypothetical protein
VGFLRRHLAAGEHARSVATPLASG